MSGPPTRAHCCSNKWKLIEGTQLERPAQAELIEFASRKIRK